MTASGLVSGQAASRWYGISRQAYYQSRRRRLQRAAEDQLLVELVQGIRQRHPRMGGRKLYHELCGAMASLGISRGRDTFFALLRRHDLLVPTRHNRRRTTYRGPGRCPNLLAGLAIGQVHQAWVGDITYLTTRQGFVYLAMLTDAFSRFIVGFDLSASLAADGCLRALDQAIARAADAPLRGSIHHSDHGVQYTAWAYFHRLQAVGMRPSMGQVGNCYENALAERVIGILKGEYGLDHLFRDQRQAASAVREAVWLYNYERPHLSLDYRKPAELFFQL